MTARRARRTPTAWRCSTSGEDIDYNGPSGPQEFSQPGEPTAASFAILSYASDSNTIDDAATVYQQASL